MDSPKMASMLGTYDNMRGKLNIITIIIAFILSIMVIHTNNQCEDGQGYDESSPVVSFSFGFSVTILVICCVLICIDLFIFIKNKRSS